MSNINYSLDFELNDNNFLSNLFGIDDQNIQIIEKNNKLEIREPIKEHHRDRLSLNINAQEVINLPLIDKSKPIIKEHSVDLNEAFGSIDIALGLDIESLMNNYNKIFDNQ